MKMYTIVNKEYHDTFTMEHITELYRSPKQASDMCALYNRGWEHNEWIVRSLRIKEDGYEIQ